MQISNAYQHNIASIKQALGMVSLLQAMNQDAATVGKLLEGMEEASRAVRRTAVPHLGNNVDILV